MRIIHLEKQGEAICNETTFAEGPDLQSQTQALGRQSDESIV